MNLDQDLIYTVGYKKLLRVKIQKNKNFVGTLVININNLFGTMPGGWSSF